MKSPFRYFNSSPEVIRLTVMMYIRYPRFLASHAAVYNTFNIQPHLISRPSLRILRAQADRAWQAATVAA